jgi:hypothetical protein
LCALRLDCKMDVAWKRRFWRHNYSNLTLPRITWDEIHSTQAFRNDYVILRWPWPFIESLDHPELIALVDHRDLLIDLDYSHRKSYSRIDDMHTHYSFYAQMNQIMHPRFFLTIMWAKKIKKRASQSRGRFKFSLPSLILTAIYLYHGTLPDTINSCPFLGCDEARRSYSSQNEQHGWLCYPMLVFWSFTT